jgi:glycosyltransferase involved in cell wall biosynthesis
MSNTIWYISKYVAPPGSGTAGGRGYLLMKELVKLGHKVLIITSDSNQLAAPPQFDSPYLFQELDGIQLCWVKTLKYTVAKSFRRILSWLDFEWRLLRLPKQTLMPPDVVVVSSLSLLTVFNGLFLRARYKCRLVLEVRDIWPLTITEEGGFKNWNPLVIALSTVEKLGYKHADVIVGTMPNLSGHVNSVLGYPKVTHCIPMGVDETTFATLEELPIDYINKYFSNEKFMVAHVGSIGISNALNTLFECAEAMKNNSAIHFLIVGDGDLRKQFQTKYGHLQNLTFAPQVPKTMVQAVLSRCDLLYFSVHVSKVWLYGQSLNKVIDYMMSGKPIVASYTGYPSMINEAACGSYVPAGDVSTLQNEILRYANMSTQVRAEIGKRGRVWLLQNRSYSKLAKDYLEIMTNNSKVNDAG